MNPGHAGPDGSVRRLHEPRQHERSHAVRSAKADAEGAADADSRRGWLTLATNPINDAPYRLLDGVTFGEGVVVSSFTNLYRCTIGDGTRIGPFVEIQANAVVGANCKISSHAFICEGVELEDEVFIGHGVMFVNDNRPRATTPDGRLKARDDWELLPVVVERRAAIGSGAIVLGGVRIGRNALVGAGAVVTRDVAADETVAGVPARTLRPA
jgi:UDP-2-acetamido-3-amino-2,3-dideoxy-glucuronate N-acetyltransferase